MPRPKPSLAGSTGGTGVGGGGPASCPAACTTAADAPYTAAAGAPPLSADRATQGATCRGAEAGAVAAIAPVELTNIDPATTKATTGLNFKRPIKLSQRRASFTLRTTLTRDS